MKKQDRNSYGRLVGAARGAFFDTIAMVAILGLAIGIAVGPAIKKGK